MHRRATVHSQIRYRDSRKQNTKKNCNSPPICQLCLRNIYDVGMIDSCTHRFCYQCIITRSETNRECFICGGQFSQIYYNFSSPNALHPSEINARTRTKLYETITLLDLDQPDLKQQPQDFEKEDHFFYHYAEYEEMDEKCWRFCKALSKLYKLKIELSHADQAYN